MRRSGSGGTVLARSLPPRFARNERIECARCQEGEVLEAFVSKKRGCKAALKFLRKMMKRYPRSDAKPPEIRHCPFCRLLPLQPAKASLFMGQLQVFPVSESGTLHSPSGVNSGWPNFLSPVENSDLQISSDSA